MITLIFGFDHWFRLIFVVALIFDFVLTDWWHDSIVSVKKEERVNPPKLPSWMRSGGLH